MLQKKKFIFIFILLCLIVLIFNYSEIVSTIFNMHTNEIIEENSINISQELIKIDKPTIIETELDHEAIKKANEEFAREYWKEDTASVKQCPFSQLSARGFTREEALNIINNYDIDESTNIDDFIKKNKLK